MALEDQVKGKFDEVSGKTKEVAGAATGDAKLEAEGKAQNTCR